MVLAARRYIGGMLVTPCCVARIKDHTVPMTTTNSIADSSCPNHIIASGTQQTLGSACNPNASIPIVSLKILKREQSIPIGMPMQMPME